MGELKKCPFCGGKSIFNLIGTRATVKTICYDFIIKCAQCEITSPKAYTLNITLNEDGLIEFIKDDRQIAINDWNRRFE